MQPSNCPYWPKIAFCLMLLSTVCFQFPFASDPQPIPHHTTLCLKKVHYPAINDNFNSSCLFW